MITIRVFVNNHICFFFFSYLWKSKAVLWNENSLINFLFLLFAHTVLFSFWSIEKIYANRVNVGVFFKKKNGRDK